MSDPSDDRRGWPPIVWACLALPLWATATILVSELHNVLSAIAQAPLDTRTPPTGDPALVAILSIAQPICLVVVLQGIVQHTFHTTLPVRGAVIATLGVAAVFGFGAAFRTVPLLLLPAWLYAQSRTLAPAMASLLPGGIATSLEAMGVGIGVAGFDRISLDAQWQPLWFNALGLGLLIVGLLPLIRVFTTEQR
jgi:hypothetical protein